MKQNTLNLLLVFTLVFSACNKKTDIILQEEPLVTQLKAFVKIEVSETAFIELDWSRLSFFDRDGKHEMAKIPLKNKTSSDVDKAIYITKLNETYCGNYVEIYKHANTINVIKTSLDGVTVIIPKIENGYTNGNYKLYKNGILEYDSELITQPTIVPRRSYQVSYTYENNSYLLYYLFELGVGDPNSNQTVLSYINDNPLPSNTGGNLVNAIMEFEDNDWETKPSANIIKIFNCFDLIANNQNTTYEISLNSDIPANGNEERPFLLNGNPGHAFLTITKKNGSNSVTQNFGFYPNSGPKSLGLGNVTSKIVDDNNHEINASIKMNIDNTTFDLIRQNAIYFATQEYNLESNNCANFAIDLFNIGRLGTDIVVPNFVATLPATPVTPAVTAVMAKSPHALFAKLNDMKTSNHPESANIQINRSYNSLSGNSHGECQ